MCMLLTTSNASRLLTTSTERGLGAAPLREAWDSLEARRSLQRSVQTADLESSVRVVTRKEGYSGEFPKLVLDMFYLHRDFNFEGS